MLFPTLKVNVNGFTYTTESMGLGEFSVFYIYWIIKRLNAQSIILIEEPECFIPPLSQLRLMNIIASFCEKQNHFIIITTHSSYILERLPIEHINLLLFSESSLIIKKSKTRNDISRILGINIQKKGVFLVEDKSAQMFLTNIINSIEAYILVDFDIYPVGSYNNVINYTENIVNHIKIIKSIGIVDGDIEKYNFRDKSHILSLPGDKAPDFIIKKTAYENISYLSSSLGIDETNLRQHLQITQSDDHHDWIHNVSRLLYINVDILFFNTFKIWINISNNHELSHKLIQDIKKILYPSSLSES